MKTQLLFQVVIIFFAKMHFSVFKNLTADYFLIITSSSNPFLLTDHASNALVEASLK